MGRQNRVDTCIRILVSCCLSWIVMMADQKSASAVAQSCGEQPVHVCIMMDRTGSVSDSERGDEATAAKGLIDKIATLNNGTKVAIGRFGDGTDGGTEAEMRDAEPNTGGTQTFTTNYAQAKLAVDSALSSGSSVGTNIEDAIEVCRNALVANRTNGVQDVMIFISDGDSSESDTEAENIAEKDDHPPFNSPDFSDSNYDAALDAAREAKGLDPYIQSPLTTLNPGIRIFSIAFGAESNSTTDVTARKLMAMIASGNSTDNHCDDAGTANDNCDATERNEENTDGDDYFISPKTSAELENVFTLIFQVLQCQDDGNACTVNACNNSTHLCEATQIDNCLPCQTAGDCSDGNVCTNDSCVAGRCQYGDNNGASCNDADGCTVGDKCNGGRCTPGNEKDCSDGRFCSVDECISPSGQCDNDLSKCGCNSDADCNDGNQCTDDVCDLNTGQCANNPDNTNACNDGNACTSGDHCDASQCVGSAVSCNDNNPCTDDSCNPEKGCQYTNDNTNSCSDNLACTDGDACVAGVCVPGGPKACNDGRSCSSDSCTEPSGACDYDLSDCGCSFDSDCDDGNSCTDDSCNVDTGQCSNVADNANSCNDGNECTTGDHCDASQCVGSTVSCDDNNPCTDDSCSPETGCVYRPDDTNTCSDELGCTLGDACVSGSCVPGAPKVCDDNRACSTDSCVDPTGDCKYDLEACGCNSDEDCNDGNSCTDDVCDLNTGQCSNPANDENACDDNDACSSGDQCVSGQCVGEVVSCDDGNPCTDDSCSPESGCVYRNDDTNTCSDANGCSIGDACVEGSCVPTGPKDCSDGRSCSTDSCSAPSGECSSDIAACLCNADSDCNDNNPCTDDSCNLDTGECSSVANDSNSCDDANACTTGDQCVSGSCQGATVSCNDNNPCTDDACDTALGCVFANDDANDCSDSNGCTDGDQCVSGSCVPGGPKSCDDGRSCSTDSCSAPSGQCSSDLSDCSCNEDTDCNDNNPCTADSCDANTGQCSNSPLVGNSCDDGSVCTSEDQCNSDGLCDGTPLDCDDGDPCTADSCDGETGCQNTEIADCVATPPPVTPDPTPPGNPENPPVDSPIGGEGPGGAVGGGGASPWIEGSGPCSLNNATNPTPRGASLLGLLVLAGFSARLRHVVLERRSRKTFRRSSSFR